MIVTFLTVGSPSRGWATDAVDHYQRFLSKYAKVDVVSVRAATVRGAGAKQARKTEAERLLLRLEKLSGLKIACDSGGRTFTSEKFAEALRAQLDRHGGRAVITIGGPYGLDGSVLDAAHILWSFGPATLPHELALLTAMEQTARAFSILRGDAYHK